VPIEPGGVQQAHDRRRPLARTEAAGEQPILSAQRDRPDQVFDPVVVDAQFAVVDVARESGPAFEAVIDGLGCGTPIGHLVPVCHQPSMQQVGRRPRLQPSDVKSFVDGQVLDLALDVVQRSDQLQGLLGQRATVVGPQLMELASRIGHATGLRDASRHGLLVSRVIVTDQRAAPAAAAVLLDAEEAASVAPGPTLCEVEHHRVDVVPGRGAVAPQVRPVRLAQSRLEHGNWRFIGMQHTPAEQVFAHGLYQRRQLHPDGADPLGLRRARHGEAGPSEDALLPIQRLMIDVLGHRDVGHQPSGGDAFVDDVRGHGHLDQRLAPGAGPLATHMTLHRERTGRVVELLGHVLADALERAAATARRGLRLVAYLASWEVRLQCVALGLALLAAVLGDRNHSLDLAGKRLEILVDGFFEQALLLRAEAFAGGSELQSLQHRHLVRELVDHGLLEHHGAFMASNELGLERDLRSRGAPCLAQLLRVPRVDVVVCDHGG